MSDPRGWLMAEKEHEARLAAVKADYERRIAQLERELAEARGLVGPIRRAAWAGSWDEFDALIAKLRGEGER